MDSDEQKQKSQGSGFSRMPGVCWEEGTSEAFMRGGLGTEVIVSCSYVYGRDTAIGPHTEGRCWPLLAGVWRAIALLMTPWCAEGEVPTASNLNLYRGRNSCVRWHCDDEPLFGGLGIQISLFQ